MPSHSEFLRNPRRVPEPSGETPRSKSQAGGLRWRAIVVGLLAALPATAAAPRDQYAEFVGSTQAIKDNKTLLVWQRFPSLSPVTFQNAVCPADQRLPTLKELLTIVDEEPHFDYDIDQNKNVVKWIDDNSFGGTFSPVTAPYWSSSMKSSTEAWTVDFQTGKTVARPVVSQGFARCVKAL